MDERPTAVLEWPGLRSEYAELPPGTQPTLTRAGQVGVAFSGHARTVRESDGRTERVDVPPGVVYVTGAAPVRWLEVPDPTEALEMYPDPRLIEQVAGGRVDVRPALGVIDGVVFAAAARVRRAHRGQQSMSEVEGSSLAHHLVHHLLREYAGRRGGFAPAGRLSWRQVQAVNDYVLDHRGARISLDDLAATARLSPYHFARCFTATTGLSPHAFTTLHRLTAAKDGLLRTEVSVVDVAHGVGYTNVAHFRRAFVREFGVTPGMMRAHQDRKIRPSRGARLLTPWGR